MTSVLDSSALLALILRERGADEVLDVISDSVVSPVILAETLGKAGRHGWDVRATETALRSAGLEVAPVEPEDIRLVAELHQRPYRNISLADRFCLALAMRLSAPLVTADHPWADLGLPVDLRFIR